MLANEAVVCNLLLIYCQVYMFGGVGSTNHFPYLHYFILCNSFSVLLIYLLHCLIYIAFLVNPYRTNVENRVSS